MVRLASRLGTGHRPVVVEPDRHGSQRISAGITRPNGRLHLVTTEANVDLDSSATPWLPAALCPAMHWGADLRIDGPVDSIALGNAAAAARLQAGWFPKRLSVPAIEVAVTTQPGTPAQGVGCFFSGGVDSFCTAIGQNERITHLIFVWGFDIALTDRDLLDKALGAAREAATALGKPLIEVTTDLRPALGEPARVLWGREFHGAAMAHVATALAPVLGTVIIPSSFTIAQDHPWGSTPQLDPLWSSSRVIIEQGEPDVDRAEKIRRISRSPIAMKYLRVCWENRGGAYNCGKCPKCIRTQLVLTTLGAECATLPGPVDPAAVRRIKATPGDRLFLQGALDDMRAHHIDMPELEEAIETSIRRGPLLQHFRLR